MQRFTLFDGSTVVVEPRADGSFKLSLPMTPTGTHWAVVEMDDHHVALARVAEEDTQWNSEERDYERSVQEHDAWLDAQED